jgi:hypothetical protein
MTILFKKSNGKTKSKAQKRSIVPKKGFGEMNLVVSGRIKVYG